MSALLVRSVALLAPIAAVAAAWIPRPPSGRRAGAAILATLWALASLLAVHVLAMKLGWWSYVFEGGGFEGMPMDLAIGWALLWGALPVLLMARVPLLAIVASLALLDVALMPLCAPIVRLGPSWLTGELVALALALAPAQLLGLWTDRDEHLTGRVALQVALFSGGLLVILPALALHAGRRESLEPALPWSVATQLVGLAALPGLSAVQEFALRGGGTPFPADPPRRLVTSGPYAYVRNPMQVSATLVLLVLAATLRSGWLALAAVVGVAYSAGLAWWDEEGDLRARFPESWPAYRAAVRAWWPRWRPFVPQPATIFVASSCEPCSSLARWLRARQPAGLHVTDAESYPTLDLERVRYEAPDGTFDEGVAAVARALEHVSLGWAFVGWTARLPAVRWTLQVVVDGVGGGPRMVVRERPCGNDSPSAGRGRQEVPL